MRRALLSLPAAVLVLTGCQETPPGTGSAATSTATSTALPGVSPTSRAPVPTSAPVGGKRLTVDGVVRAGVEPGCDILVGPAGHYLLLGAKVPKGVPVRVEGVVLTGVSTTCQQGTPFRVLDVQRR